ncbi:MAG: hypothetical protein H0U21_08345 [Acidimicrobiia bacterium]|nr:hypothetical protein [Acidimicrobiia bacterium]
MFVVSAALAVSVFGTSSTGAAGEPPETFTETHHGLLEEFTDVFPTCDDGGADYDISTVTNSVKHGTIFADGRGHFTFTQTGTFTATPADDPTLPDASGRFTVRGGFNANGRTVNGTFTFSVRGVTDDGGRINFHLVGHFNERPDGTVSEFFRCHD